MPIGGVHTRALSTLKWFGDLIMGILNGLIGNASGVSIESVKEEISPLLIDDEVIEHAFKLVRDLVVFTNKRLILSDKQGLTETSGHFDLDGEVKIWISGQVEPSERINFKKGQALTEVQ